MAELYGGIRFIKGIGEQRAKNLEKLDIHTLYDLVSYFPRSYDDRSRCTCVADVSDGEYSYVRAWVCTSPQLYRVRGGRQVVKFEITDETGKCGVTFFNQPYVKDNIRKGGEYRFYGKFSRTGNFIQLTSPIYEAPDSVSLTIGNIVPVYHLTSGISQKVLVQAIRQGLNAIRGGLPEILPRSTREKYSLIGAAEAYELIHFPKTFEDVERARTRLIFEELFVLSCALKKRKSAVNVHAGRVFADADVEEFFSCLPFEPTKAQKRAIADCFSDMRSGKVMSRLVQGDVGSGKTLVAAACFWLAAKSGAQSAFMAPTEILAEQHYMTLSSVLEPFGIKCILLTGGMTKKMKSDALEHIALGEVQLVIGTHAILSEGVSFCDLALAVTDEQHRFGVKQRTALSSKGNCPHVLVMSATPIPRTLALIIYGDLDVSIIDELPPGRQKIDTFAVNEGMRERINNFIAKLVGEGRQVYIICPAVYENEASDLAAVESYYEKLGTVFPGIPIGCLHGKMKNSEKEEIMRSFKDGEIKILVSTTVVEVGVDVPNAALIVVENAERLGLNQLHQLRGRVGRGKHKSYCILFDNLGSEESKQRLGALCKLSDGFKISEVDLQMRGPGDFFGSRQSGIPMTKLADLSCSMDALMRAQEETELLLAADPELSLPQNRALADKISALNAVALN